MARSRDQQAIRSADQYLILSHDHRDYSAGSEVFSDTATVIAREKAKDAIIGGTTRTCMTPLSPPRAAARAWNR